ncbi:unnamed protein product [Dovyalis caffra]|uniref:Uncharacterized protein n=1 Tax=Dovyalis caffra TaxID=77055 RepID=A0AAV1R1X7_9ROSI|nr:unnamed protein product [Dovyalis caffra]
MVLKDLKKRFDKIVTNRWAIQAHQEEVEEEEEEDHMVEKMEGEIIKQTSLAMEW